MNKPMTPFDVQTALDKWDYAPHVGLLETSIIREILKISSKPGVISFAGGLPAPEMFPLEDMKLCASEVIDLYKSDSLQYSLSLGITPFRDAIAARETMLGAPTKMENIMVTSGSQQGIDTCARAFIDPGDYIITENPTYVGALQAFNFYQTRYATVEMDENGMIVDQLEGAIKKYKPKLIYTVSNFQNPTGITMSLERRYALLELALKYNLPLVEDNPYGEIIFSGTPVPSLKSLGGDAVISLGTFSKILTPGLRIAWINAAPKVLGVFEKVKQCSDLHTSTFAQYLIYAFMKSGKLDPHIKNLIKNYGDKRNWMLKEMDKCFPSELKWTKPDGGLFLWVEMPKEMSGSKMLPKAIEQKVAYVYGSPFFPDRSGDNCFRLNFSHATLEGISEGIKRLGEVIKQEMSL
jgi:2-aminoadipate transaminase